MATVAYFYFVLTSAGTPCWATEIPLEPSGRLRFRAKVAQRAVSDLQRSRDGQGDRAGIRTSSRHAAVGGGGRAEGRGIRWLEIQRRIRSRSVVLTLIRISSFVGVSSVGDRFSSMPCCDI